MRKYNKDIIILLARNMESLLQADAYFICREIYKYKLMFPGIGNKEMWDLCQKLVRLFFGPSIYNLEFVAYQDDNEVEFCGNKYSLNGLQHKIICTLLSKYLEDISKFKNSTPGVCRTWDNNKPEKLTEEERRYCLNIALEENTDNYYATYSEVRAAIRRIRDKLGHDIVRSARNKGYYFNYPPLLVSFNTQKHF